MAVEARHLNPFLPQIPINRELGLNGVECTGNVFASQIGYGLAAPHPRSNTQAAEFVVPVYGSPAITATVINAVKTPAMKSECVLTDVSISRKRSREAMNSILLKFPGDVQDQNAANQNYSSFNFLGEDISFQIQQQQLEIDRFIVQHNEKVRLEIEDRRKRYCRRIAEALENNIIKTLKAKEDEIDKIGKLNFALEERAKSLCIENQLWRDLAQSNEATANALRSNLSQLLTQLHRSDLIDDARSCCGSNKVVDTATTASNGRGNRVCKSCNREESCVLLLPCRHLCLCTTCGSTLLTCPVCNSTKTASVHVNLSPSS